MPDVRPLGPAAAALAPPALRELRPHCPASADVGALTAHLHAVQDEGDRFLTGPAFGRMLSVDDLSTLPGARGCTPTPEWRRPAGRRTACTRAQG